MDETSEIFVPFENSLDLNSTMELLKSVASGADDAELFLERQRSQSLVFDDGRLREASYRSNEGFGLRGVLGETAGYAHSTEVSEASLKRAAETVKFAIGQGGGSLAPPPQGTNRKLYSDATSTRDAEFSKKVELLSEIDAYLRDSDPRIVQASATISNAVQQVVILRPDGTHVTDFRPMSRLNLSVIIEEDGKRRSGGTGIGGRYSVTDLTVRETWKPVADEALRIAMIGMQAKPAPAGVMDVVLGPGWPGILLHEAVGHGLEGDFNRKGSSAFSGLMGQQVAAKGVTVVDDGTIPNRRGSISVDDEGTPSQKTTLIEDGILTRYMNDRQNARLLGAKPTGNGRRESYAHSPMPRMTNTYMLDGDSSPADIVADLKDGIHAVGFGGGQVDITSGKFVFSCTEAYRVRNGKVGEPVENATLIGDGASALKKIRAIGNDLELDPGIGTCGKEGQWVPVGVGLPTVLIGGLTVGGSAA